MSSIVIDEITLICKGCYSERVFYPDAPLVGAQAFKEWIDTRAVQCGCGASKCDIKGRLRPESPVIPEPHE